VGAFARHAAAWVRGRFEDAGRFVFVAAAVVGANSAISYGYTKDEIMSPGGMFYAVAAFAAVRELLRALPGGKTALQRGLMAAALIIVASGWAVRSVGVHYKMRLTAFNVRNEWVDVDRWLEEQHASPEDDEQRRIVRVLRDDAIASSGVHPFFLPRWAGRWLQ
jgi:hypothetical protein